MIDSQRSNGVGHPRTQIGSYRVLEPLGHGGMGAVHLAARRRSGRDSLVVLKLLREHLASDDKYVQLFRREAAIATRLSHPNVVRTLEVGQDEGRHYLAMEFLDGQPFNALLRQQEPPLPLAMRLSIVCEALNGLHYVHELRDAAGLPLRLIHRDVSPSNVFVTYEGDVKLLDFGVAKLGTADETSAGEFRGRLGYAAPERLWGRPADRRSDVFAAGVMLWEAVAGKRLAARIAPAFFEARLRGREPSLAEVVPGVDGELARICEQALHVDPESRYQTAELFGAALRTHLGRHGGLWERSAIAQVMQQRFAPTRREMHERIHKHLYRPAASLSSIPAVSPIALAAAERSAIRARPQPSPLLQPAPPSVDPVPRRRPWLLTLCLIACVALVLFACRYLEQRVDDVAPTRRLPASRLSLRDALGRENAAIHAEQTLADRLQKG